MMRQLLATYQKVLSKYPLSTQSIQTGILMGSGDALAQLVVEKRSLTDYNKLRTVQFFGLGCLYIGPVLTIWYGSLNKFIIGTREIVVLKKVACDQLLFAPVFIASILGCLGVIQGKNVKEAVKKDYKDVVLTNYMLWPWVQLGNFYFIPVNYQVLVTQIVALVWNTYISWKTQTKLNCKD